jgi:putative ABC transport system substrate-binding protein
MRHAIRRFAHASVFLCALWCGVTAMADPVAGRVVRVGYLRAQAPDDSIPSWHIRQEMAKLGYVEGRNIVFEVSHAGGDPARLPAAAAELVTRNVDVIFAVNTESAMAAKAATKTIPIVAWGMHGAVELGLVSSLRRPGGNVTGIETMGPDFENKRIQLLRQLVPGLALLAVVYQSSEPNARFHWTQMREAVQAFGLTTLPLAVDRPQDFDPVFAAAANRPMDALLTFSGVLTVTSWPRIRAFALSRGLPTLCEFRQMAESGCLLSYGPTFDEITRRAAAQIDKILHGAVTGDLPMEQPTRFELIINLKTAKELGLAVPQELLLRADAVIE